jgi:hypothetical protein
MRYASEPIDLVEFIESLKRKNEEREKYEKIVIDEIQKKNVELEKRVAYLEGLLTGMKVWYDPKPGRSIFSDSSEKRYKRYNVSHDFQ